MFFLNNVGLIHSDPSWAAGHLSGGSHNAARRCRRIGKWLDEPSTACTNWTTTSSLATLEEPAG